MDDATSESTAKANELAGDIPRQPKRLAAGRPATMPRAADEPAAAREAGVSWAAGEPAAMEEAGEAGPLKSSALDAQLVGDWGSIGESSALTNGKGLGERARQSKMAAG